MLSTTSGTLMFENVVVGATDSEGAVRAVRSAIEVARAWGGTLAPGDGHPSAANARRWPRTGVRAAIGLDPTESLLRSSSGWRPAESVRVQTHPLFRTRSRE